MNLTPLLAEPNFLQGGIIIIAAVVIVVVVFLLLYMVFSRYTKVGPNQVLVVSGTQARMTRSGRHGTTGRLPHRQRRRHVRLAGVREGGHPLAGTADH